MSKLNITLDTELPLHSLEVQASIPESTEGISIADEPCVVHDLEYFGHDHNTDYLKCTVCGHMEEE